MGAIVGQNYASNHPDVVDAVVLFGSWIQSETNEFPMPFLTLMGTIDGGGVSLFSLEVEQTAALPENIRENSFALIVEDVNHAQVFIQKVKPMRLS